MDSVIGCARIKFELTSLNLTIFEKNLQPTILCMYLCRRFYACVQGVATDPSTHTHTHTKIYTPYKSKLDLREGR